MIDKNGKLFGKISVIDILIAVVLLLALFFVINRLGIFSPEQVISGNTEKIRITFYQEEVNTFTANNAKIGDPVTETLKNASFGNVVDLKTGKSESWGVDKNGNQVKSTKDGFSSIFITTEVNGKISADGITISDTKYYIGQLMTLRVGTSTFYCRLYDVEKVQEG